MNKALQQLKVQTWFNAVAEVSGKTAYELEKEFAPPAVDRDHFNKQRARLWEKYRLGKVTPKYIPGPKDNKPIALRVEEVYPGTLKWLINELGDLADTYKPISMELIRQVYESLPGEIRNVIINDDTNPKSLFWRRKNYPKRTFHESLVHNSSPYAFVTLLALFRESIICQDENTFNHISNLLMQIESKNITHGPIPSSIFIKIILTPVLTIY